MKYQEIFAEFTKAFTCNPKSRGIGVEFELPVISESGEAASMDTIQEMFEFLGTEGFQLERDEQANIIIGASRINPISAQHFEYSIDTVMTDAGCGIVELVMAPQLNLHLVQESLTKITALLVDFFDNRNCKILGYGIQPLTAPSRQLLMPRERYSFFEKFSPNNQFIPKADGSDAHLLTVTASSQCHIDIDREEAITSINVLNAFSGLQIILNANSPIWRGGLDPDFKANREVFWECCYPDRLNQLGIPPKFQEWSDYIQYFFEFKPMLIERDRLLQILNKETIKDFMLDKTVTIGRTLDGEERIVQPEIEDIHYMNTFCYFNARLVPKLGTIESRMCCQQPPGESLAPTAISLGLLANLEEAQKLADTYPVSVWKQIRLDGLRKGFKTLVDGQDITPLLAQFIDCARRGLTMRNLGEEEYLVPYYERLKRQMSPADEAAEIFANEGFQSFVNHLAFTIESHYVSESPLSSASY